jgi:YesN/AraC family two-component response regulator
MDDKKRHDLLVLYVEDDAITREEISYFLMRRVRAVLTAKNGEEGFALFRNKRPDLIVTDIAMPVMDGIVMAKAIREIDRGVPIILTTAHSDATFMLDVSEIGNTQCVVKPISTEKLASALDTSAAFIHIRGEEQSSREQGSAETRKQ